MKHLFISIIIVFGGVSNIIAQSTGQNYILSITPNTKVLSASTLNTTNSTTQIQYLDGLGRPVETVQKGITPTGKDLVTLTEYDEMGREWKQWLPKTNSGNGSFVEPTTFINLQESLYNGDSNPFNEIIYEPSPLNRIKERFGAGQDWKSNNKRSTTEYLSNSNDISYFYVDNGNLAKGSNYEQNTLFKTSVKDEDGKESTEYEDKSGQVILKQGFDGVNIIQTYFVYNDLGQLCYVIPPKAIDEFTSDLSDNNTVLKQLCYLYKYDNRGNCIYKRLPGCEPIYMAYDAADRLVQSQDGNQRLQNQWTVTKYDVLGREIYTGTITDDITTWDVLKNDNYLYKNTLIVESYTNGNYSNTYFSTAFPLEINYYDDYQFVQNAMLNYVDKSQEGYGICYTMSNVINAKGLQTGTVTYLLDGSNSFLSTVNYYDDNEQIIQSRTTNLLGGYDIVYHSLNFIGNPVKTLKEHSTASDNSNILSELYTYTYDHAGRITKTEYKINDKPSVILADMTVSGSYDELARLKQKKRHNGSDIESFEYNIRNWTTKITSGGFEENLFYNTNLPSGASAYYNGNISASTWKYNTTINGYDYSYDGLNRLTSSNTIPNGNNNGAYANYEDFWYDKMGNVTFLSRSDANHSGFDNLVFSYNGNQVTNISDEGGSQNLYNLKEYHDKEAEENEMAYDPNGNLIKDLDRDIVTIKYNVLNLPEYIQFKNGNVIKNLYKADGQKLRTDYYTRLTTITPLDDGEVLVPNYSPTNYSYNGTVYIDNKEYAISKLKGPIRVGKPIVYLDRYSLNLLYNPEGYVTTVADPQYFYFRKDHLSDNREVWCANTGQTIQRTQYYASGLPWAEGEGASAQNKKYNGKEWRETHGYDCYDIVWRQYYPAIMRFQTPDPEAEEDYDISPYAMCGNNMVMNTDPDGRLFGVDNLIGAVVGAAVDYGGQVAANYASGNSNPWTNNINLVSIGTSAVVGGLTSGASAVQGIVAKTAIKVGGTVINNTVQVKTSSEGLKVEIQKNAINVIKNTAIDLTVNKVTGKAGSKVESTINKKLITKAGQLRPTAKTIVKFTGNNVTRKATTTTKKIINKTAQITGKTTTSATKAITKPVKNKIKDKTDIKN